MTIDAGLSLDEFINHAPSGGGGTTFLRGWRKRKPAVVDTWLHKAARIIPLWQHQFPQVKNLEDKQLGVSKREVWGGTFNCHEVATFFDRRRQRDRETGRLLLQPTHCPVCRLSEWLRSEVKAGRISVAEPLFRLAGDADEKVLTVGGFYNGFSETALKYMPDNQKLDMRRAGIRVADAWKENAEPKCNYVFRVVDNDHLESGVQIAVETTALGDAVKDVIRNQMKGLGEKDGNPLLNPYCIRWEHNPTAKEFSDKYGALPMPRIALTPEVEAHLVGEPPDITRLVSHGNAATLLAQMQSYVLVKRIPWEDIFGPALAAQGGERPVADEVAPQGRGVDEAEREGVRGEAAPAITGRRRKAVPAPVQTIPCDECKAPMGLTDTKCRKCGAEYDVPGDVSGPAPTPPGPGYSAGGGGDDDIPFDRVREP